MLYFLWCISQTNDTHNYVFTSSHIRIRFWLSGNHRINQSVYVIKLVSCNLKKLYYFKINKWFQDKQMNLNFKNWLSDYIFNKLVSSDDIFSLFSKFRYFFCCEYAIASYWKKHQFSRKRSSNLNNKIGDGT